MEKICETGMITENGGLLLPMDRVNDFLAQNRGKRVIVRFEAVVPGSTPAQQVYYSQYIVPTVQEALKNKGTRWTEKQVDLWLRQQCASCYNDYGGLKEARQLSLLEMSEFIDWIKQFAAENLSVYVEDSKTL